MSTDRELLRLAAKATGLLVQGEESRLGHFTGLSIREDDNPGGYRWNPLEDDGDALRLAVRLRLDVMFGHADVEVTASQMPDGDNVCPWSFCAFAPDKDDYAATRRAIVRAAASIGEQLCRT